MTERQLLFVFGSPGAARVFVKRVVDVMKMTHIAFLVVYEAVIVVDGYDTFRKGEITRAARSSGCLPKVPVDSSAKS